LGPIPVSRFSGKSDSAFPLGYILGMLGGLGKLRNEECGKSATGIVRNIFLALSDNHLALSARF